MAQSKSLIALDVGEKRIGVAVGDSAMRIAIPYETLDVDGGEVQSIARLVVDESVDIIVVGYPRNQSGRPTQQTEYVEAFAARLSDLGPEIIFQDESLTSVIAEQQLKGYGRPYTKADIDMQAATIILQDYMERL